MIAATVAALAMFHVPVVCGLPAGTPATVRAYTWGGGIVLNRDDCASIADLQAHPNGAAYIEETSAVMVLAHELAHSYGVGSENGANCVGGTMVGWVADRLGLAPMAATIYRQYQAFTSQSCEAWAQEGYTWQGSPLIVPVPAP